MWFVLGVVALFVAAFWATAFYGYAMADTRGDGVAQWVFGALFVLFILAATGCFGMGVWRLVVLALGG